MDGHSLWKEMVKNPPAYPPLKEDIEVDVLIIGGGITGVTAAIQLLEAGKKIAIVDSAKIGGVTTSMSTGNLYVPVQPFFQNIVKKFGLEQAKQVAQSRLNAIDYIEAKVKAHQMSCHFYRRPWYAYTMGQETSLLTEELNLFKQMKLEAEWTNELPYDLKFKKAIVLPNQARFNPYAYVVSLAEVVAAQGGLLFENTHVLSIEEEDKGCKIWTADAKIEAKKVFMATHTPLGVNPTQMFTAPYRSYVVGVKLETESYPEAHLWNLDNTGYAISAHAAKGLHADTLLVAGRHHKTGQGQNMKIHFKEMETFIRKNFPVEQVVYQWSAQHYHSADDLPYVGLSGRGSKHLYMATGYFADGLVYGTLAGAAVADLILRKKNKLADDLDSTRVKLWASFPFLVKENVNVFTQYAKDLPKPPVHNFDHLKAGEGQVVEINREKCGVCRDENNELHIVSAVCPHMKCIVNWNNAEQTWDCPCHGSRFKLNGEYIEGPAMTDLKSNHQIKK